MMRTNRVAMCMALACGVSLLPGCGWLDGDGNRTEELTVVDKIDVVIVKGRVIEKTGITEFRMFSPLLGTIEIKPKPFQGLFLSERDWVTVKGVWDKEGGVATISDAEVSTIPDPNPQP